MLTGSLRLTRRACLSSCWGHVCVSWQVICQIALTMASVGHTKRVAQLTACQWSRTVTASSRDWTHLMLAQIRATVLGAMPRPVTTPGAKQYLDVFLRQDGQAGVVEAYADPIDLAGEIPTAGQDVICTVTVYPGKFAGRMSVRVDEFRAA